MDTKRNPRTGVVMLVFGVVVVWLFLATVCEARIIIVNDDGPADFNNIQAAIDDSDDGDFVVVLPGTYKGVGNRNIDFLGKAITVRSSDPNDPNIVAATIIDCNGTYNKRRRGFKFHSEEGPNSVVSGLTITNGFAAYEDMKPVMYGSPFYAYAGGAIFCKLSSPTITHCRIIGNRAAGDRGAICYSYCSSPTITKCIFTANDNGGIHLYHCSGANISACTISNNSGMGIYGQRSGCTLTNSTITDNSGLGIAAKRVTASNCNISNNRGGISADNATITNCVINNNSNRGGIYCVNGSLTISNSSISGNSGSGTGGIYADSATITGCTITGNSTGGDGGGIYCWGNATIENCNISGNSAGWFAGGICCLLDATITNCVINGNSAEYVGAISCFWNATISNCLISGNSAKGIGAIYCRCYDGNFTVANCTITSNIGQESFGGGICCSDSENVTIHNCIIRDNESPQGHEMYLAGYGNTSVSYSDILGGPNDIYLEAGVTLNWNEGNIDLDPCFVEVGYWDTNGTAGDVNDDLWVEGDYHLLEGSPCIDAGDPNYMGGPTETDIDGEPRVMGLRVDMGADEVAVLSVDLSMDSLWMYQNLPVQASSNLTASASITYDPNGNSSYSYEWEILLPGDVNLAPMPAEGCGGNVPYLLFAARGCDEPGGLSDSGQVFTVRVTVTGDDYGNTGQAEAEFGIALLGDINNDGVVNVADRSIANAFWRTGSAGAYTLRDCDVNCDGVVNVADRSIANAIWRGILGQNSVSSPCPLR
ncbi:MAG: right-handed parallel beta-helix repeat-containing protein [Planctomycetota bacterium]|nr:MAG: right-handed parallel beta-helix repeat-containing protein [Planctomycetota bacterium]